MRSSEIAKLSVAQQSCILGMTCFSETGCKADFNDWPTQYILAPTFEISSETKSEVWFSGTQCRTGISCNIAFRADEQALFGVLTLDESDFPVAGDYPTALETASESAYRQIFALLNSEGYSHLWRVWNYLSDINTERNGLERYRQFNIGRHNAFAAFNRPTQASPAASALGVAQGPLTIAFLAGHVAPIVIDNPRQVNAFEYPVEYGPRSPAFTRAVLIPLAEQELFFISGTSSIVGHKTVHAGDVRAQTQETLANIVALLNEVNRQNLTRPLTLRELNYRVYIRHAEDFQIVRNEILQKIPLDAAVIYLQADVCRVDLLVEIEAAVCARDKNSV